MKKLMPIIYWLSILVGALLFSITIASLLLNLSNRVMDIFMIFVSFILIGMNVRELLDLRYIRRGNDGEVIHTGNRSRESDGR